MSKIIHYRIHNSQPLVPILNGTNPPYNLLPYFLTAILISYCHLRQVLLSCFFLPKFYTNFSSPPCKPCDYPKSPSISPLYHLAKDAISGTYHHLNLAGIAQSVSDSLWAGSPGNRIPKEVGEIFRTPPERPWGPPNILVGKPEWVNCKF